MRTAVDATVELPGDLGDKLIVSATQLVPVGDETQGWDVDLEVEDVELAGVSTLHTAEEAQFETGSADLSMSDHD